MRPNGNSANAPYQRAEFYFGTPVQGTRQPKRARRIIRKFHDVEYIPAKASNPYSFRPATSTISRALSLSLP